MRVTGGIAANAAATPALRPPSRCAQDVRGVANAHTEGCSGRPRFQLSDESGVLRFKEFSITGSPECSSLEENIRAYLVGRPLKDVDVDVLRSIHCPAGDGCLREVIREVQKHQRLFVRNDPHSPAACRDVLATH